MKKILFAAVTLFLSIAPATFAQPPGRPPGAKPDTEKKDEPEKPAPELKVTAGLVGASPRTKRTGTSTFPTACWAAGSSP